MPGHFLSDDVAAQLEVLRSLSLQSYNFLHDDCSSRGIARFPMKPKLHAWDHLLRQACDTRENPTWNWLFADEDMVGRIKNICIKCNPWTMSYRVLKRWACAFFAAFRIEASGA